MMKDHSFDIAELRVELPGIGAKPKKWRRQFVRVPWGWIVRLRPARRACTFKLALVLLYEAWRAGGQPIVLSNVLSQAEGLSRRSKWNALAELEGLGLIQVERRPRRSPRLILLNQPEQL